MRIFCLIFVFIFLVKNCVSQNATETIIIDKLPFNGVLLDKSWKFHAGDNPNYANANYDDSKWQSINPTLDIHALPQTNKSGICWLRLHIVIDSSLLREQLSFLITQSVASEIYLNGRLLYKFGTVSVNPKEIKAYNPLGMPFSFPLDKNTEQLLSVRYELQPNLFYVKGYGESLLKIQINKTPVAMKQWRRFDRGLSTSIIVRIGAFFILAVLYLAFFLYYPEQKANLFFFLYALLQILGDVVQFIQLNGGIPVQYIFLLNNLAVAFWGLAHLFLLTALYSLLQKKRTWIYGGLSVAIMIGIFLNVFQYPNSFAISEFLISNVVNIEIVRTA